MVESTNQDKEFHCNCCRFTKKEDLWEEVDPDDMSLLEEQTIKFMENLNNND